MAPNKELNVQSTAVEVDGRLYVTWTSEGPLGIKPTKRKGRLVIEKVMPDVERSSGVKPGMRVDAIDDQDFREGNPMQAWEVLKSTTARPIVIIFSAPPGMQR